MYTGFFFLAAFWTGILLLLKKERWNLNQRLFSTLKRESTASKNDGFSGRKRNNRYLNRISGLISGYFNAGRKNKAERELSEVLAYVKNMVVLGRGMSISAQLLMEELAEITNVLSDAFIEMSRLISLNDINGASLCLADELGGEYGKSVGHFLAGWEEIPPGELLASVNAFQSALREARETKQRRRDEMISDLIYFPVVVNCMAVLLNFIYISFYVPQKEMLETLF